MSIFSKPAGLFAAMGIALAMLVGWNVLIHQMARTSDRHRLLSRLKHLPPNTDCVFLGNSLVEAGCDTETFREKWPQDHGSPTAVNLALGATSPVEHYLILQAALDQGLRPKYVIYGFFDDQLTSAVRGDWQDLVGNRAISYYFADEAAAFYAPGSILKKWELRLTSRIPMMAERSSLWGRVEDVRREIEEIGLPKQAANRFGRTRDFVALEAADADSFNRRCKSAVSQATKFSGPVQGMVDLARKNGATVIMVEMPMPTRHRTLFYSGAAWADLRRRMQQACKQQQAVYISAADWVKDDAEFMDVTHLNQEGARRFSTQLAIAVAALNRNRLQLAPHSQNSGNAGER
nr:hypothetical protein Hi04_10k_c3780_00011 [uncultured bacterium]